MVLLKEVRGRVLTLTLHRPEVLNALSRELLDQLRLAWMEFNRRKDLWLAVLTGAGERAFCVGADLKEKAAEERAGRKQRPRPVGIHRGLEVRKPVICAINGIAVGGGLELAMACDLRISADHATLGLPEVKRALIPAGGGTQRLPRMIPIGKAMELLLTGDSITAHEALSLGLLNRVVPQSQLITETLLWAETLCANGPLATQAIKKAVWGGLHLPLDRGIALETRLIERVRNSRDAREGISAFVEKRKPEYRGE